MLGSMLKQVQSTSLELGVVGVRAIFEPGLL